jgi:hypothetical protein
MICSLFVFLINNPDPKMYIFLKISFLLCLDDLQFKCIIRKQSGSELEVKAGFGSPHPPKKKNFGSTTL